MVEGCVTAFGKPRTGRERRRISERETPFFASPAVSLRGCRIAACRSTTNVTRRRSQRGLTVAGTCESIGIPSQYVVVPTEIFGKPLKRGPFVAGDP
jgi:hypothetical protein